MNGQLDLGIDPGLPIAACAARISDLIRDNQVVVVAGETGSGKTTQLPKICLALGRKSIGHTQPRRIAARSVAARIAEETGRPLGEVVGYQIRFTAATSAETQLKVMTDGILLAEIAHDRRLMRYDTIIIDEAHERSLNIDFLLGYLKQLLPYRPDLKIVITSATIDTARFSAHFSDAPIVEIAGRAYPVEVVYDPVGEDDDPIAAVVTAVARLPRQGDILVFCSGEREIREAAKAVAAAKLPGVETLPLFARLTMEEQARVFAPHAGQRVVLATNVAETSLTVPGIRYVVDPGYARISRYSARTKVQRLPIEPVSQASANQRAGRCGRLGPGICIRLYSEEDFLARPAYTEPEILRTNLASVILAMANARLGEIADFPFVEAPDRSHIADGLRLLAELGAIASESSATRLTSLGRNLAALPVDPRLGRMLLEGAKLGCLAETIIVVAGLSIPDVRERPADKRDQADVMHSRFASDDGVVAHREAAQAATPGPAGSPATPGVPARITPHTGWGNSAGRGGGSGRRGGAAAGGRTGPPATAYDPAGDFAALLRLWDYVRNRRKALSGSQFRKLCRAEFLNYPRIQEWSDLVAQLREICRGLKLPVNTGPAPAGDVLTACLAGLLSNIGSLDQGAPAGRRGPRQYTGTRGAKFAISPGSVLARATPELVMAVELVETTRLWAGTVAAISPDQVERVGAHLIKRSYSDPVFAPATGTVVADESRHLLGVPLGVRRADYTRIDPRRAREVFITQGLVEGLAIARPGSAYARVVAYNAGLRAEVEALEAKTRRRDLRVDDTQLAAFFDERIPGQIATLAALEQWLRSDTRNVAACQMTWEDLVGRDPDPADEYPDVWSFGDSKLELNYRFAPGDDRDGVTVKVPLASLASLEPARFSWGVPGGREALATELIRTLPKPVRTRFVPAPDWARRALAWLADHDPDQSKPFADELARALTALSGDPVAGWNPDALPDHLKMGFLVGTAGHKTVFSRDLAALQAGLGRQVKQKLATASPRPQASGTTWVFGAIPETVTITEAGLTVTGYPGLTDARDRVSETIDASLDQARANHERGLARLVTFALPEPYRWIVAHMTNQDKIALGASPYPSVPGLLADARLAAVADLIRRGDPWAVRDEAAFAALVQAVRPEQVDATHRLVLVAAEALRRLAEAREALTAIDPAGATAADVTYQIDNLVFDGFLTVIPVEWLARVPVWLRAAEMRVRAAAADPVRDLSRMSQLEPVLGAYDRLCEIRAATEPVARIGYLIEEFRVQIFAQTLRTAHPVSAKRILTAIAGLG